MIVDQVNYSHNFFDKIEKNDSHDILKFVEQEEKIRNVLNPSHEFKSTRHWSVSKIRREMRRDIGANG